MASSRPRVHSPLPAAAKAAILTLVLAGCGASAATPTPSPAPTPGRDREAAIPSTAVKMGPGNDASPVVSLSEEYEQPVMLGSGVNTAGAEDSPFVLPDGKTLYFFFTPDVSVPPEKQVLDGVTGIWVSHLEGGKWGPAQRVVLQDPGKLALDGCEFVSGDVMWFCSAREGYEGIHWFTARYAGGRWTDWQPADFPASYEVGELDIGTDGNSLYFHSTRAGGKGGLDVWLSRKSADGSWGEPTNVAAVNTDRDDGWPALSPDEQELWVSRDYALWRSRLVDGEWQTPVEMFAPLAGEAAIDAAGNVYFVHHYFDPAGKMIEADIYVAHRKAAP
jgi:hypothetical protein